MKNTIKSILLIFAIISILNQYKHSFAADSYEVDIYNTPIESTQLKATRFTPILDTIITTGENLIYCSTFQLAWNKFCLDILNGKTTEIKNAPDYVKILNTMINEPANVPEDSYVAMAGYGKDGIVDKINNELKRKLTIYPIIKNKLSQMSVILFSCFYKNIIFEYEFEKNDIVPHYFYFGNDSVSVETFGGIFFRKDGISLYDNNSNSEIFKNYLLGGKLYRKEGISLYDKNLNSVIFKNHSLFLPQFKLIYVNEPGEPSNRFCKYFPQGFIIELISKSKDDEIIISTIKPDVNLLKSYEAVNNVIKDIESKKMIRNKDGKYPLASELIQCLGNCDGVSMDRIEKEINIDYSRLLHPRGNLRLIIPKIRFNIINIFLGSKKSDFKQYDIVDNHNINFSLCGKGIQNNIYIKVDTMGNSSDTRLLISNPFIIYIRKKCSNSPYFMAYIGNAELLVKSDLNDEEFIKNYLQR